MALSTQPYKGARDFYPEDKRIQDYIFSIWRSVAQRFGYEEYDASLIEPIDLYLAKTSQEIVNDQTYVFEDRGGRKVTLRPEMTPTVSRMVAGKRQELAYPLRWFSIPNLWRYERPQRGRLREHWQLNVDLFGESGIPADHELILVADAIMQAFGAQRDMYVIRLNSRQLVNYILQEKFALDNEGSIKAVRLVDRMHKMPHEEFRSLLAEIVGNQASDLEKILLAESIEALPNDIQQHPAATRIHELQVLLARAGVTNVLFDMSLMRGFDYYTDIVFEMFDTNPENNRALFGGGRYDGLVGLYGVDPVPTVGFGMGDVAIKDFLETHHLLPSLGSCVDIGVICIGNVYGQIQQLLATLRDANLRVAVDATERKMDKKIKSAAKAGYPYVLFVGETEIEQGEFRIKNLETGQEDLVKPEDVKSYLGK